MGIVGMISTKDHRDAARSDGDADDPLPPVEPRQDAGAGAASTNHHRHLRASPTAVILTLALLLGGVGTAVALGTLRGSHSSTMRTTPAAPVQATQSVPGAGAFTLPVGRMTTLHEPNQGFTLDYPSVWTKASEVTTSTNGTGSGVGVGGELTVLRMSGQNAFSIRAFDLQKPVATPQLADMRAVTDAILSTPGAKLTVLDVRSLEVGGLPAVYYLYYFPFGSQQGIHAHYFVFNATRMYSIVFQVVPAAQFPTYAAEFDAVIASFRTSH